MAPAAVAAAAPPSSSSSDDDDALSLPLPGTPAAATPNVDVIGHAAPAPPPPAIAASTRCCSAATALALSAAATDGVAGCSGGAPADTLPARAGAASMEPASSATAAPGRPVTAVRVRVVAGGSSTTTTAALR